jgi:hypothetical protein
MRAGDPRLTATLLLLNPVESMRQLADPFVNSTNYFSVGPVGMAPNLHSTILASTSQWVWATS